MWSSCSSVLLLHAGKWFQPGTMSHATSQGPYLANFGVGFRLNRARARLAPHTSQLDEEGHFWYTESGEQVRIRTRSHPRGHLYLDPKGYVIPHPHASSASYKRNRSTSMLVYRVWQADLYLEPKGYVIPYPHASSASYKRNRSTSMGAYRVWRADLYLDPKGYVIPHPHASSASYKRNRSTSMLVYRVWRADLYLDPKGYVIPYPQEVHRCWYPESGERVQMRNRSYRWGHQTLELDSRSATRARVAPHTSSGEEVPRCWYTESGQRARIWSYIIRFAGYTLACCGITVLDEVVYKTSISNTRSISLIMAPHTFRNAHLCVEEYATLRSVACSFCRQNTSDKAQTGTRIRFMRNNDRTIGFTPTRNVLEAFAAN
ncbi:hypothetical protein BJ742DRAFT_905397 [Cladochytrium replicatum]|nr:hypothetical protein BJ742DRAFT_905397 [Cladochytrium replicatum]